MQEGDVPAIKDPDGERPIPSAWRPVLCRIVDAFVRHDYRLADGIVGVAPLSEQDAPHVRDYIADYGATLVALPAASWDSSVCIWMGDHWDALVDLWTKEEGRSDLVLRVRVAEADAGYRVTVHMVYVP